MSEQQPQYGPPEEHLIEHDCPCGRLHRLKLDREAKVVWRRIRNLRRRSQREEGRHD